MQACRIGQNATAGVAEIDGPITAALCGIPSAQLGHFINWEVIHVDVLERVGQKRSHESVCRRRESPPKRRSHQPPTWHNSDGDLYSTKKEMQSMPK